MDPKTVADAFSSSKQDAVFYLKQQGMSETLNLRMEQGSDRIPPDYRDLARLHLAIRSRRVLTILEFGSGFSTISMADALLKNNQDWSALSNKPRIRNSTLFQLHTVESSKMWLERTACMIPEHLRAIVTLHYSAAETGLFQDRACHYYANLPDIVPDFIYLDGPDPATVTGDIGGLTWRNRDRVVTSGDILRMEPQLLPGTMIVIDGRTANARFLAANLDRNWRVERNTEGEVTVFELQEMPLGPINRETLRHCLGERALSWEC